jgi:hypothetical protein
MGPVADGTMVPAMTDLLESRADESEVADGTADVLELDFDPPDYRPPRTTEERWHLFGQVATVLSVAAAVLFTFFKLHPELIFKNTIPAGGDMGAHVWGPAYLRDHLLPHGRISGWAPDWYDGFPMYQFYMVVPALMLVALDVILPYGVALKFVSVLGLLSLPVAVWLFGKLAGLRSPIPQLFAWAAVAFMFDETFTIWGGNIASTMAGEFSFSIALSFAFFYFAVLVHALRTGKLYPLAAVLFALAVLSHGIVAIFVLVATPLLWVVFTNRRNIGRAMATAIVGGMLAAFWIVPFILRRKFLTDMGYERSTNFWKLFFPYPGNFNDKTSDWNVLDSRVVTALAIAGLLFSLIRGFRAGAFLGLVAIAAAVGVWMTPQLILWNVRLLPFFYLARYLLAALGIAEITTWIVRYIRLELRERRASTDDPYEQHRLDQMLTPERQRSMQRWIVLGTGVVVISAIAGVLSFHLRSLPGGRYDSAGVYHWGPFTNDNPAFVDGWAKWNYSGYQGKAAYGEYYGVVTTMKQLGQDRGCGRALWENNNDEDAYGTPMALMLLPFWTDGCIASQEGLFFEASGTTPYHFLSTAALSQRSSNPVRRLSYEDGDVAKGVQYLQTLGVRYYLAYSPEIVQKADQQPDLTKVATSGPWSIYEVRNSDLVVPLTTQPVVARGVSDTSDAWLELGTSWFQNQAAWAALPVADGPKEWQRIDLKQVSDKPTDSRNLAVVGPAQTIDATSLTPVTVSNVVQGDDRISFHVDQVGVPVLVRVSYFPNWKPEGAEGPYRVAPNLMVVIPTKNDVSLHYGYTGVDLGAYALTGLGLLGLVLLWQGPAMLARRRRRVGPATADTLVGDDFLLDWDEPQTAPPFLPPPAPLAHLDPHSRHPHWSAR